MINKLLVLFLLQTFNTFSQNTIENLKIQLSKMAVQDTLMVNLNCQIAKEYTKVEPEKGKSFALKALEISQKLNFANGIYNSQRCLGNIGNSMSDSKFALEWFVKNQKSALSKTKQSQTFADMSLAYSNMQDFTKGVEYGLNALKISEKLNNERLTANNYTKLGIVYYYLQDTKKALQYNMASLKINTKLNDEVELISNYGNLANNYVAIKNFEKSIFYQLKCNELTLKLGYDVKSAIGLTNITDSYMQMKQFDKAIASGLKALPIAEKINNLQLLGMLYGTLGGCYFDKSQLDGKNDLKILSMSENYFLKSVKTSKIINNKAVLAVTYNNLRNIDVLRKDYKKAFKNFELSIKYKDSLINENTKETVQNLEDQRKIELRDNKLKINSLQIESDQKQKWFFAAGLLFLGIIGSLLFYQNQNKKKINQKLSLLNESLDKSNNKLVVLNKDLDESNKIKIRFFNILNHDLRNPVSSLIQYLKFHKSNADTLDLETKKRLENTNLSMAENLLSAMEDMLLWSKGQMENFKPQIKNFEIETVFNETKRYFLNEEEIKITFENPEKININSDENYLKTIIRNLTSNAIKAIDKKEKEGIIIWKVYEESNQVYFSITDNGAGASKEQLKGLYDEEAVVGIKTGLGLHLIRDLAKAIQCEITVSSKINIGTTFILKF